MLKENLKTFEFKTPKLTILIIKVKTMLKNY